MLELVHSGKDIVVLTGGKTSEWVKGKCDQKDFVCLFGFCVGFIYLFFF